MRMIESSTIIRIGFSVLLLSFAVVIYRYKKGNSNSPIMGTIASVALIAFAPIFGFVSGSLILKTSFRSTTIIGFLTAGTLLSLALYTYIEEPFANIVKR